MTDLVAFGETMLRLSPTGGERLETARSLQLRAAGAESNAAVAAARLGADALWTSKLPDTPLGHRVVNELRWYGLETDVAWSDEGRQGVYFLEQGGQPRGEAAIHDRADAAVRTATADELPTDRIEAARAFFTSGVTPALSNTLAETTANLLSTARRAGTKTVVEVNYQPGLWEPDRARAMLTKLFAAVDVLVAAVRDARRVLDVDGEAQSIAHSLASKWEFDTVVLTRGDLGAIALHDGVLHEQPVFEADTVDPSGVDDAFVGAFVARRLAGDDVPTALEHAAAAAALKRTIPGDVAAVTLQEVREVVEGEDGDLSR